MCIILKATVSFLLPCIKRRRDGAIVHRVPFVLNLDRLWKHSHLVQKVTRRQKNKVEDGLSKSFMSVGRVFVTILQQMKRQTSKTTRGKKCALCPCQSSVRKRVWHKSFYFLVVVSSSPPCYTRVHRGGIWSCSYCTTHQPCLLYDAYLPNSKSRDDFRRLLLHVYYTI